MPRIAPTRFGSAAFADRIVEGKGRISNLRTAMTVGGHEMRIETTKSTTWNGSAILALLAETRANLSRRHVRSRAVRQILFAFVAVAIICAFGTGIHAQTTAGSIVGTLIDQMGAVLPDTQVTLINIKTDDTRLAKTNQIGFYRFVNVPPASYRISVQKQGFKQLVREPIELQVASTIQIDLRLQVGSANQNVVVTTATPLIQVETTSLGAVIDQRETNEIPLNGRNPMNLTALVPSVIPQGGAMGTPTGTNIFAWGNYQIGGGMANQSATYLDGSPLNASYDNLMALVPTQDSLEEFKVATNDISPEYGRLAGGAINFTTKSGTNDLHGGAWEFIRNKIFNANTFFSNRAKLPNPPFTQNQYGFNIGGPVMIPHVYNGRNRTFFFLDWEGFGLRQGQTFTETVPTTAERGGDLSALGIIVYDPLSTCGIPGGPACAPGEPQYNRTEIPDANLAGRLNPTAVAYVNAFYPLPDTAGVNGQDNFISNTSVGGDNYQTVVHIDQNISDKQHLSGRYTYWANYNKAIDPLGTGICYDRCGEVSLPIMGCSTTPILSTRRQFWISTCLICVMCTTVRRCVPISTFLPWIGLPRCSPSSNSRGPLTFGYRASIQPEFSVPSE